jgi:hypothetical protein
VTTQSDSELRTFREFVEIARLPIVMESIVKRDPPEPDVLCRFRDGEVRAFELVEICNPQNAHFMYSATEKHGLIVSAYLGLPLQIRQAFDVRFIDVPLSFRFRRDASMSYLRQALPRVLTELASVPSRQDEYTQFSAKAAGAVTSVRERGKLNDPGQVNFNIGGQYDPVVSLDAVEAKLHKTYTARCPIELIAHFGPNAWGGDRSYREGVLVLLERCGLGPFRRIWIQDWQGIGLVVPAL